MKKHLKLFGLLFLLLAFFSSCKEETPAPTASFTAKVDGNVVTFTAEATNYTKFEWDFGDGSYINTLVKPVHAYAEYGKDFNVTLTVIGEGGQVSTSNKVTIPPKTKMQLLTGGTSPTSSRKWRISMNAPKFLITAPTTNFQPVAKDYPGNILLAIGLDKVYTDEFVFKGDGTMTINSKGGGIFAGYVYCVATKTAFEANAAANSSGLAYAKPFTPPTGATFKINEGKNLPMTVSLDGKTTMNLSFDNVTTLSFTNKGFLGILDFSSECIIQDLSDSKMVVAFFVSTIASGPVGVANMALIVTFEVAQ